MATRVQHAKEQSRYEVYEDDVLAGHADYELGDGEIAFVHTEVDDAFQGRGLAGILVRAALDDVRDTSTARVIPRCPYVKRWIEQHEEYAALTTR